MAVGLTDFTRYFGIVGAMNVWQHSKLVLSGDDNLLMFKFARWLMNPVGDTHEPFHEKTLIKDLRHPRMHGLTFVSHN